MSKLLYIFCFLIFAFLPSISFGDITLIEDSSPKTILCKEESPYVYMSIIIKSGIVSEAGYNFGMTTFISKLILNQTRLRNPQELQEVFFSTGCHLSMVVRLDYLEIKVITHKKTFSKALDIIGECLSEPRITKENIQKAKNETIDNMTMDYDTSFQRLYDTLRQNMYTGNPYKRSINGTVQSIKNIDNNSIAQYYKENFSPNNMVIAVVGDLDDQEIKDLVKSAFSGAYRSKRRSIYDYNEKLDKNKTCNLVNYDPNDELTYYMQGYFMPGVKDEDYYSCVLLSALLGSGKSSYVFRDIRQKYGIGYFIGFKYEKLRRQSQGYFFLSTVDSDNVRIDIAKKAFDDIIQNIKSIGVSDEDLNRTKDFVKEQNNIENLNLIKKAHKIAWNEAVCGDYTLFEKFPEKIQNITNKDIIRVANKYFTDYCEVILRPKDEEE
ncbi:MAG: insulinase family protein [Abditibacteriota bacterium]|nr:insulinase family protein [Abditibacteriota bacterium]